MSIDHAPSPVVEKVAYTYPTYIKTLFIFGLAFVLFNASIFIYITYLAVTVPKVTVTDVTVPPVIELCPGGILDYQLTLNVSGAATVDVGTSLLSDTSLRPSYVRLQQFIFKEKTSFTLVRHFVIPPTYTDPEFGSEVPWKPGKYWQRTLVNVEGRSSGEQEVNTPFTIKENCKP